MCVNKTEGKCDNGVSPLCTSHSYPSQAKELNTSILFISPEISLIRHTYPRYVMIFYLAQDAITFILKPCPMIPKQISSNALNATSTSHLGHEQSRAIPLNHTACNNLGFMPETCNAVVRVGMTSQCRPQPWHHCRGYTCNGPVDVDPLSESPQCCKQCTLCGLTCRDSNHGLEQLVDNCRESERHHYKITPMTAL